MMSVQNYKNFDSCIQKTNVLPYQIENNVLFTKDRDIFEQKSELLLNIDNINQINTADSVRNNTSNSVKIKSIKNPDVARRRWHILAKAINRSTDDQSPPSTPDEIVSVRRFTSFDIITSYLLPEDVLDKTATWHCYRTEINNSEYSILIRHPNTTFTAEDLIGFNNTGNICVWPSEEALAYCVLSDLEKFDNKWVLELGGGMSCLAGLMLAKYGSASGIHLTDGNQASVNNVRRTIGRNELNSFLKCTVLKWEASHERQQSEKLKYDFILSADCLFFDDARDALVDTMWYHLSDTGVALVMAPKRGDTLEKFMMSAFEKGFKCTKTFCYNDRIWEKHLSLQQTKDYDENIHYPILLELTKSSRY